ncbi:MAG: hypothetical protein M1840_003019 [Geoglossum simile]|nr:MAG: hypothetical protein M1840_003019 [Geoglossum simile]
MRPKQKRKPRVPPRSHHPLQSSIDVPAAVKAQVKAMQDNRCWLCNQKAYKRFRPLQICLIFPQAISKRFKFVDHHKSGQTQLVNIHDVENLIPLCSICHLAFDQDEWTFLPKDMEAWVQAIKIKPEGNPISEYNAQRDLEFRRWRLHYDPDSEASQDRHYVSAFTDRPIQRWGGEPGVLIIRNTAILGYSRSHMAVELQEALGIFNELKEIWLRTDEPCQEDQCRLCRHEGKDKEDERDEEEDGWEDEGDEEGESDGNARNREDQKDQKAEEDERSGGDQPSLKIRKTTHQNRMNSTRSTNRSRHITTRNVNQKKNKPNQRKSTLYDKSVPYSHREGYTFARCTANDLMNM